MPFRELVPDFRGGSKDRVTLRQVLTHTAGLAWWQSFWKEASSPEEVVWLAGQGPLAPDSGEFRYSDLGCILLTAGLGRVAGGPFAELMRDGLLEGVGARSC